jgi:hypothetical protein
MAAEACCYATQHTKSFFPHPGVFEKEMIKPKKSFLFQRVPQPPKNLVRYSNFGNGNRFMRLTGGVRYNKRHVVMRRCYFTRKYEWLPCFDGGRRAISKGVFLLLLIAG